MMSGGSVISCYFEIETATYFQMRLAFWGYLYIQGVQKLEKGMIVLTVTIYKKNAVQFRAFTCNTKLSAFDNFLVIVVIFHRFCLYKL